MPSRGRKFITEFLLPSLNKEIFDSRLMWLDIQKKVFQIQWNHKSASDWTTSDAAVFAAWDKRKGHYNPDDKEYYPKSKQRFRAALYKFIKLKYITELYCEDKYTKIYCMGDGKNISGTYITVAKSEKKNDGNENSQNGKNISGPYIAVAKSEKKNDGNENSQNDKKVSGAYIAIAKSKKKNDGNENSQKVKQNPEDLVIDWDSIWTVNLLTEPQENCLIAYHNPEMKKDCFVKEEQVVTDYTDEFVQDTFHYENLQNYVHGLNSSSDNKKNFSARETSTMKGSEDVKSLHCDFCFVPETNIYEKDNNLKRVITIGNDNFHDYICTVIDTQKQPESPDQEFCDPDEDFSFDLPIPCI